MGWRSFWVWVLKQTYKYRMKYGYKTPQQPYNCYMIINIELDMIIKILEIQGFDVNEYHPLQFLDTGQIVGARKKISEWEQIHVRMYNYKNAEGYSVHAHIEFIPEKAPLRHILGWNMKNGCNEFKEEWSRKI